MTEKYLENKLREIEGEIAVLSGVSSMLALMEGKVTDQAIKCRDDCTKRVIKIVHQIIKRNSLPE